MCLVTAGGSGRHRLAERAAVEPDAVAELDEVDCEAGVLTERHAFRPGDSRIFEILAEEIGGEFARLLFLHDFQPVEDVGRQVAGGLAAEFRDRRSDRFKRNDSAVVHDDQSSI